MGQIYDPLTTSVIVTGMRPKVMYAMRVQQACFGNTTTSPFSEVSSANETKPTGSLFSYISGNTVPGTNTMQIDWDFLSGSCELDHFEINLFDPHTYDPFTPEGCTNLTDTSVFSCVATGLEWAANYVAARGKVICTDDKYSSNTMTSTSAWGDVNFVTPPDPNNCTNITMFGSVAQIGSDDVMGEFCVQLCVAEAQLYGFMAIDTLAVGSVQFVGNSTRSEGVCTDEGYTESNPSEVPPLAVLDYTGPVGIWEKPDENVTVSDSDSDADAGATTEGPEDPDATKDPGLLPEDIQGSSSTNLVIGFAVLLPLWM
jgi:hypothetical protein